MRNRAHRSGLVAEYRLPPDVPADLNPVLEKFDRVRTRYAEHVRLISDAEEAVAAAKAKDDSDLYDAIMEGAPTPKDPRKNERAAQAKLDSLRASLPVLEDATDAAGNELLEPIAEARPEWLADLTEKRDAALARAAGAVLEVQEALEEAATFNGGIVWLSGFDATQARVGMYRGWHGKGRLEPVEGYDPRELLKLVKQATEPPAPPQEPPGSTKRERRFQGARA